MKIITQDESVYEIAEGLKNRQNRVIVDYTSAQVNYGFDDKPDFEYCKTHNIPCIDLGRRGGAFVINKGDVGFGDISVGLTNVIGEFIYDEFVKYLKDKGLNASQVSNDILIDGYKVFGWSSHYYAEQDVTFLSAHFTMSVDLDLISKIFVNETI